MLIKKYGVVQGRLLPQVGDHIQNFPIEHWRHEFLIARDAGVSHIEWSDRLPGLYDNPISYLNRDDVASFEVPLSGICVDSLMDLDISLNGIARSRLLYNIAHRARVTGVRRLIIPLLEKSSLGRLNNSSDAIDDLARFSSAAADDGLIVSFETDLSVNELRNFMNAVGHRARVTIDTGNIVAAGYKLSDYIDKFWDVIDNVHIKDFVRGVGTVPLGKGDADLCCLKRVLNDEGIPMLEHVTFQTARSVAMSEADLFRANVKFMEELRCD